MQAGPIPIATLLVFALAVAPSITPANEFTPGDFPHALLTHQGVRLVVYLPDAQRGFYRGTRFDHAGFVARAEYQGHRWFGPWQKAVDPKRHDRVMGTAGEFGMGTNGMASPLGFDAAPVGGTFVKIGVGTLRKDATTYRFHRPFEIVQQSPWDIDRSDRAISFRQRRSAGGFGYRYVKRIAITEEGVFTIRHTLENTGTRPIQQTYYSHNFIQIDDQPIGDDYRVEFPLRMTADRPLKGAATFDGRELAFRRRLRPGETVYVQFTEQHLPACHNGAFVENTKTGAALQIYGDAVLARYHLWACERAVCPEPFVLIDLDPGQQMTWTDTYELIVSRRRATPPRPCENVEPQP